MVLKAILILMFMFCGINGAFRCSMNQSSSYIDCSKHQLKAIPKSLPFNSTMLDFNTNNITSIPNKIFRFLTEVKWLDLSNNKIERINKYSFFGLGQLSVLNLTDNLLYTQSFENASFIPIQGTLLELRVPCFPSTDGFTGFNRIQILEIQAFSMMVFDKRFITWSSLHTFISLGSNGVFLTNNTLVGLINCPLRTLWIKLNQAASGSLKDLHILDKLDIVFGHRSTSSSVTDAFKMISYSANITSVTLSSWTKNKIFTVTPEHMHYIEDVCIQNIAFLNLEIADMVDLKKQRFSNRYVCLETLQILSSILPATWTFLLVWFPNLKVFNFRLSIYDTQGLHDRLPYLQNVKVVVPGSLQTLILDNFNLAVSPPNIYIVNGTNLRTVICKRLKFTQCNFTVRGLKNLNYLDISFNNCSRFNYKMFRNFPKLETFIGVDIGLGKAYQKKHVTKINIVLPRMLKYIDVSLNVLDSWFLSDIKFTENLYNTMQVMNFSRNKIASIPNTLSKFKQLSFVDFSYNLIKTVSTEEQRTINKLWNEGTKIFLEGNPFNCLCSNIDFLRWVKKTNAFDIHTNNCYDSNGDYKPLAHILESLDNFEKRCKDKIWLIFALTFTSVFILTIISVIVYYRYRSVFQYLHLKIKLRVRKYEVLEGGSYLYDVFICYNHKDTPWVVNLSRSLSNKGFKTCLDAKDFIAGDDIAENILRSIDNSRKIIFIITENFLRSTWGNYEIEMTRMHAFQEGRDNMIIVILKDDIPIHRMPSVLRKIWYKVTCIKYFENGELPFQSDETFHENIYNALSLA